MMMIVFKPLKIMICILIKNGDLNKVDLGTYETYRVYGGEKWDERK